MKKLLVSLILFLGYVGNALAEPEWAQKPVQCADTQEVLDRIEGDNMLPLVQMIGNAQINRQTIKMVPYVMYYNTESQTWAIVEFLQPDYSCIIGVGQGVNFDVGDNLERDTL